MKYARHTNMHVISIARHIELYMTKTLYYPVLGGGRNNNKCKSSKNTSGLVCIMVKLATFIRYSRVNS